VDGDYHPLVVNDARLFAHTSPVWLMQSGKRYADADAARFFVGWIDRLVDAVRERGKFPSAERREETIQLFRRARKYYETAATE
jgi:hypothetical protein